MLGVANEIFTAGHGSQAILTATEYLAPREYTKKNVQNHLVCSGMLHAEIHQ